MVDLQAIAAKVSTWSSDGVKIAAAANKLYAAYLKLEPTAKASIQADVGALEASWTALDDALDAYDKDNSVSKVSAAFAVANTLATLGPLIGRIAKDGETLFSADWPIIQPQVMIILNVLEGHAT